MDVWEAGDKVSVKQQQSLSYVNILEEPELIFLRKAPEKNPIQNKVPWEI